MNSKGSTLHRSNYLSEGYEDYEETDGGTIGSQHALMCEASVNFNGSSRAEETLRNEIYKKRKREHLPEGYQQQFITKNSVQYPCHPADVKKCSDFAAGFNGCLGCGSVEHQFGHCKLKFTAEGRKYFHFQLHCHHPDVYFRNHDDNGNFLRKNPDPDRNLGQNAGVGRGAGAVVPSWLKKNKNDLSRYQRAGDDSAPQYVVRLATYNLQNKNLRRMPITTQNELPHVRFPIGTGIKDGSLLNLFDTGAALNTGQLSYHQSLKSKRPDLIHSYEEFNGTNPFDPIKLCGAISDPSMYDTEKHGILSAVIRYRTPYTISGTPCIIAFALGKDVSVNSIIGIPMITELQLEFRFIPRPHVISTVLQREFQVELLEAGCSRSIVDRIEAHDVELCTNTSNVASTDDDLQSPYIEKLAQVHTPLPPLPSQDPVKPPFIGGN